MLKKVYCKKLHAKMNVIFVYNEVQAELFMEKK